MSSGPDPPVPGIGAGVPTRPLPSVSPQAAFAAAGLSFALLLAAWGNSFHNPFHFDDSHVIQDNLAIRSLWNVPRFFLDAHTFSSQPLNATYRPLLSASYALDYAMGGGLDPFQFHVTQFLALALLAVALYFFFLRIVNLAISSPANRYVALFCAMLFSVHTANTETMNLISARSDLLSTLAIVCSFLLFLRWPALRKFQLHLAPMALGMLIKAPAVVYAPLLLLYVVLFEPAPRRGSRGLRAAAVTLPAFALGASLLWFLGRMNAPEWTSGGGDRAAYLRTQAFVWLHYLRLFFVPVGLTADTDLALFPHWYDPQVLAGLAAIALILILIRVTARREASRPVAFGLGWFVIGLIPTSSFFPLAEPANEHRIFLPFVGLTLAVVWGIWLATRRVLSSSPAWRRGMAVAALLVLVAHVAGARARNRVWASEESLWHDVTVKSPRNARGLMNYGNTQMAAGRYLVGRDYFLRAQQLAPHYPVLEINLAIVEGALGNDGEAERHFLRALQLGDRSDGHFYYARWLVSRGRTPEAFAHLRRAVELSPTARGPRELLMQLYAWEGKRAELAGVAKQTLAIDPENAAAKAFAEASAPGSFQERFDAGLTAMKEGRHAEGAAAFRQALKVDPRSPEAWNNLGWCLWKQGDFEGACASLESALRLRPDYPVARYNLKWAKAALERGKEKP